MDRDQLERYRDIYAKDLFGSVLPFWVNNGFDRVNGGIDTCLDREGKVFSAEKSVWMQGRGGWLFARVCNVFGRDEQYQAMARNALDFIKDHCIDPVDGRLYFQVLSDGTPLRKRRYVFSEYFYIMANAEYYGLTKEMRYLEEARKYHSLVTEIWKDPSDDPFKITPKFLPGAPAMRSLCNDMMLMAVTMTLRANDPANRELYLELERRLLNGIVRYQFNEEFGTLLESVGAHGEYIGELSAGRAVSPGHCLEAVWYMLKEMEDLREPALVGRIEKIYEGAFKYGKDEKYGGLLYMVDVAGYPVQAYENDMKLWWVHTEAIIAAIKLYRTTRKEQYWNDFVTLTEYAFSHFRDEKYGEWYGYLRRDGSPTEPVCKGNIFKGPFHVPRMYCEVLTELDELEKQTEV
ncbi:MAG: AGE family epimerase/isomerase [Synergistaceae bacterium]|jgi:N-acylglucosamine 2-epimerase|nr:AGE family epimerase/isomerase [Synergistaceae bacterium]